MIYRTVTKYAGSEIIEQYSVDVEWNYVREKRNQELANTDWRFVSDQTPSQEWIDYRQFLRDLPQNYPGDLGNDACDAWAAYPKPE